jgi:hypothetical protein
LTLCSSASHQSALRIKEVAAIAEEAYIYGFPVMPRTRCSISSTSTDHRDSNKAPFNQIWNDAHVFTPKHTAVVTPNSDMPYS